MYNVKGICLCGENQLKLKKYGDFVYCCHCDTCRKMTAGPSMGIGPEEKENIVMDLAESNVTIYRSSEAVERAFCTKCGTYLYWHHLFQDNYCFNVELFPDIVQIADFGGQVFYDRKPAYYDFENETKCFNSKLQEVEK